MTAEEKAIIARKIERKLSISYVKIAQMEEMTKPVSPENSIGRISRMDAINNKSVMEAALRTARKELEDLKHASRHLNNDDFGKCENCGEMIDVKRLMVMPGSRRCMKCAR
ncbi:MAG: TraR/DksA family transcriptional regulator [Bacteroidetes bacterium]|nr:MAG: TraR/DksA family transcriptional regulator [Bacteroidota bacterium]